MSPLDFFTNACMFTGLLFGSVAGWMMALEHADHKRRLSAMCRLIDAKRRVIRDEYGVALMYED
jgi:hypothetical protein